MSHLTHRAMTVNIDICHLELGILFRSMYTKFFVILPRRLDESIRTCPNMFLNTLRSFVCTHIHSLYRRILCKYHWLCMPLKTLLPPSIHPSQVDGVCGRDCLNNPSFIHEQLLWPQLHVGSLKALPRCALSEHLCVSGTWLHGRNERRK